MKIQVVETSDLGIKLGKQNIDKKLGVPPPFIDKPAVYVISGAMGSGKSSLVGSIMTAKGSNKVFHRVFDKVFYATPQEVYDSEENHPFKNHADERKYFELSAGMLFEIQEQAILEKKDGGVSCLILDDFSEVYKNKAIEVQLKKLIFKHRHTRCNIIITLLALKTIPKSIRSLIDVFIVFEPKSIIEIESFAEDVFAMKKNNLQDLMDFVYDVPYNFLFFNQRTKTYYKNFDKLEIVKDEAKK